MGGVYQAEVGRKEDVHPNGRRSSGGHEVDLISSSDCFSIDCEVLVLDAPTTL